MSILKKTLKYTSPGLYAIAKSKDPEHRAAKADKKAVKAEAKQAKRDSQAAFEVERGSEVAKLSVKIPIGKDSMLPGVALRLYENGTIEQKNILGSIIGAEASVEQTSKSKATFTMGTGVLGGKKIAGHVFLTITGPNINVVQELHEMCAIKARMFAGEVNRLAAQLTPDEQKSETVVAESIPDQIAKLAALKDQEILTEDEFAAKKAALLDRM